MHTKKLEQRKFPRGPALSDPVRQAQGESNGFTQPHGAGAGFTLIELLVVIAVLGMLASIVLVSFKGSTDKARLAKAKDFYGQVTHALGAEAVGLWKFEDGAGATSFQDASGFSNNGSCSGASCPTWENAEDCGLGFGGCLLFDGANDSVGADLRGVDFSQSFTISLWVYLERFGDPAGGCGNKRAMFVRQGGTHSTGIVELGTRGAGTTGDFVALVRRTDGAWIERSGGSGPLDRWYYVVLAYDKTSTELTLFINGDQKVRERISGGLMSSPGGMSIGGGTPNCGQAHTKGMIDEVSIYSTALSTGEIKKLYAEGKQKYQLVQY